MVSDSLGVVLYLGAGASAWAGYRTFMTFPGMFWPSGNEPSRLEVADKERALLNEMKTHLAKRHRPLTLDNYLALIHEYRSVTNSMMSDTTLRERMLSTTLQWASVQELRRSLMTIRDRICQLTAAHYRRPPESTSSQFELVYDFYRRMAEVSQGRLRVFTSNYDLVPEYLFSDNKTLQESWFSSQESSVLPRNGLSLSIQRQEMENIRQLKSDLRFVLWNGFDEFDSAKLDDPMCKPECAVEDFDENRRRRLHCELLLCCYRLHGCVAWCRGEVGDTKVYFDMRPPGEVAAFADKLYVSYPGHDQSYGDHPLDTAFRALDKAVTEADALVFLGFSFRDHEIVGAIGRSLYHREEQPQFIVVDPQLTKDELKERLRQCGRMVTGPLVDWEELLIRIISRRFPAPDLADRILELES